MLTLWVPFIPNWNTFIHMWRVDLAASIFLLASLFYIAAKNIKPINISLDEKRFLILPMLVFILWSSLSMLWAPSWKSALHHSLIWSEYLIFYIIVRRLIDHGKNYRILMTMFAGLFVVFAVPAIIDYCLFLIFGSGTSIGIRFAKYGEQVNALAPLLTVGVLSLKGKRFALGLTALAAMWLLIFSSLGRINIFLFVCGMLAVAASIFAFKKFHKHRRKMLVVIAVLILSPIPMHVFTLLSDDANIPIVRRVSDDAGISSSNNFRKLMTTLSLAMFEEHPITGVGADNFGMQVNNYRSVYGSQNTGDVNLANAETEIPERSHNEYLQILAELGTVGGLIFLWILIGVGLLGFRLLNRRTSLQTIAAVIGIGLFLASSLVSSYSFRLIQNGFVFFFVLGVAAKYLLKPKANEADQYNFPAFKIKAAYALGMTACVLLIVYSTIRVVSVAYAQKANYIQDIDAAMPLYDTAIQLDDENPYPYFYLANRLFDAGRYAEAIPNYQRTIKMGHVTSLIFSYLASAEILSGDPIGAENTFAEAVKLYPRSAFVLTRHAFFLEINQKHAESQAELERARAIDKSAVETWWTIMNDGTQKAADNAFSDKELRPIMDLKPYDAIYATITERQLRFPAEKQKAPF